MSQREMQFDNFDTVENRSNVKLQCVVFVFVTDLVSSSVQAEVKLQYNSLSELLRHFWSCFPVKTQFLEEKVRPYRVMRSWRLTENIWKNKYNYLARRREASNCTILTVSPLIYAIAEKESRKKKIPSFNGIQTRDLGEYRCDALPTELWSHILGTRSLLWVLSFQWRKNKWNRWKNKWNCFENIS